MFYLGEKTIEFEGRTLHEMNYVNDKNITPTGGYIDITNITAPDIIVRKNSKLYGTIPYGRVSIYEPNGGYQIYRLKIS